MIFLLGWCFYRFMLTSLWAKNCWTVRISLSSSSMYGLKKSCNKITD